MKFIKGHRWMSRNINQGTQYKKIYNLRLFNFFFKCKKNNNFSAKTHLWFISVKAAQMSRVLKRVFMAKEKLLLHNINKSHCYFKKIVSFGQSNCTKITIKSTNQIQYISFQCTSIINRKINREYKTAVYQKCSRKINFYDT